MATSEILDKRLLAAALSAAFLHHHVAYAQGTQASTQDANEPANRQNGEQATPLPSIIVTGKRASLATAQEIKREKVEIVDSVVAEDINKLPDFNVTEALQRVTGVQILRDRGEGTGVAIRGLTQVETMLNGREVFTAGTGRNLDFTDIPAEMVAGIDVYKTSSADQIEGGLGGSIDLRTRRPFDFAGHALAGSARLVHGDLVSASQPQFSLLASNRWKTFDSGEFGALLHLSHQDRAWREDQKGTNNPLARTNLVPGQTVIAPNGISESGSTGRRQRDAANLMLQWRPSKALELYAEGSYAEFHTFQDTYQMNISASPTFIAGSPTLFPGTNDLKSITWTNAPVSVLSFARDTVDRTAQAAVGGKWRHDNLTLKTDLSYTSSYNNLFFSGPSLATTAANFTQDLSGGIPGSIVAGTDLTNPANYRFTNVAYRTRPFNGHLTAARMDGEYQLPEGFVESLAAGLRLAKRAADNLPGLIFADASVKNMSAAANPGLITSNPNSDFFSGKAASIDNYVAGNLATARDAIALRQAFGITAPIPSSSNPTGQWKIDEDTKAAYFMAKLKGSNMPLDGNAGMRIVQTHESVSGARSAPGGTAPIFTDNTYTDYLPSLNLRYQLRDGLYLRAAASRTVTRPDFNQLSPSATLAQNTINPALNTGSAGNPDLQPIRSKNFDMAVERYFSPTTSAYATLFLKKVDGFITTVSNPEIYDGVTYQVSRPQNTAPADIKGVEVGYQQFFDFLPGWMRGLGLQANYTFVDSNTPDKTLGTDVPLQNLSRHSANLIGMYELGRLSARIAYNWRDRFLSSVANFVGIGAVPVYTKAYGWLDASVTWRIDDRTSIALEGSNLLRTVRESYYGVETRPQSAWLNDRQISLTATIRF